VTGFECVYVHGQDRVMKYTGILMLDCGA
jgi:hypothetical protein